MEVQELRSRRLALGISQKRLGKETNVSSFRISQAECEYDALRPEEVARIAAYLNRLERHHREATK